jgi:hypothetical protein
MALYATQVVGQTPQKRVLALPTTYDPTIKDMPIEWKPYGDAGKPSQQGWTFTVILIAYQ